MLGGAEVLCPPFDGIVGMQGKKRAKDGSDNGYSIAGFCISHAENVVKCNGMRYE